MMNSETTLSDADFLSVLELTEKYSELQKKLASEMSQAFFLFAQARKAGVRLSPSDTRSEFDAKYRLDELEGEFSCYSDNKDDPIMLFSALPPPPLKKAQKHFQDALSDIVTLACHINSLKKKMPDCER